ncbi:hypothetical protein PR048_015999 [Dryococelus australis]|uniref:PiggyBac transposable element-derived protein domain-containing protein n=1 Tax=Dryococelus australis TaxID=614101 RepID=A0ABQ9HII3_9NEOP|nr:hypothetical protein PR048_015999 [Dryococelus australis]
MSRARRLVDLAILQKTGVPLWLQESGSLDDAAADSEPQEEPDGNKDSDCESDHNEQVTDTKRSGTDSVEDDAGNNLGGPNVTILGKDKTTAWSMHPPRANVRTGRHNIVTHIPGRQRECLDTNLEELSAVIELLYMAGIKKAQHINLEELWSDVGTSPECFRATMSLRKFYLLLRVLRFDDTYDRDIRKATDNLAPIRNILEGFVVRCLDNYQVGEYTTIDEML